MATQQNASAVPSQSDEYKQSGSYNFRVDGRWHRCPFGDCSFVKKCERDYPGRDRHFRKWHGLNIVSSGPGKIEQPRGGAVGRTWLVNAARLVSEQEGKRLWAKWKQYERENESPFDRDGVARRADVVPASAADVAAADEEEDEEEEDDDDDDDEEEDEDEDEEPRVWGDYRQLRDREAVAAVLVESLPAGTAVVEHEGQTCFKFGDE